MRCPNREQYPTRPLYWPRDSSLGFFVSFGAYFWEGQYRISFFMLYAWAVSMSSWRQVWVRDQIFIFLARMRSVNCSLHHQWRAMLVWPIIHKYLSLRWSRYRYLHFTWYHHLGAWEFLWIWRYIRSFRGIRRDGGISVHIRKIFLSQLLGIFRYKRYKNASNQVSSRDIPGVICVYSEHLCRRFSYFWFYWDRFPTIFPPHPPVNLFYLHYIYYLIYYFH